MRKKNDLLFILFLCLNSINSDLSSELNKMPLMVVT